MGRNKRSVPRLDWNRARSVLGYAPPPAEVLEEQFDGFNDELRMLASTPYDQIDFSDLWYYHLDLAYVDLQADLFAYLFPVCLMDWQDTLMKGPACERGAGQFHYGLHHGRILERMLTADQREQVIEFFRDGLLERLAEERDFVYAGSKTPAYTWMCRFNSLGILVPDISMVWDAWWQLPSPGAAVAAIQYCSGLMYYEGENPIFAAWTQEQGGGGPYLWEHDSEIYDAGWQANNVSFLRDVLTPEFVASRLQQAVAVLKGLPEEPTAQRVAADLPACLELVTKRTGELPNMLAAKDAPIDWPY